MNHYILLQSCIVAIVVPKVEVVKSWAFENNIEGTFSVLCAHPEVKKLIMDDMITWGKDAGLKGFELVSIYSTVNIKGKCCLYRVGRVNVILVGI